MEEGKKDLLDAALGVATLSLKDVMLQPGRVFEGWLPLKPDGDAPTGNYTGNPLHSLIPGDVKSEMACGYS